jgi:phosphoserine aminotransferase
MSDIVYFTPGPSQLYPGVKEWYAEALDNDYGSISHRSGTFKEIYKFAADSLKKVFQLPEGYEVMFLGSASEAWERIILNGVEKESFHFVNGSFSKKFYKYAEDCGKRANKVEAPFGKGFHLNETKIPHSAEVICITQNETSSGVQFPLEDIYTLRKTHPEALFAVDGVSSFPIPDLDFSKIDTAFFSVQKCFGLPAGLGVWIAGPRFLDKARSLDEKGVSRGGHHEVLELYQKATENQTPATPNVLSIFLVGKVAESMLQKGIETLRKETTEKFDMLYQLVEQCPYLSVSVDEVNHRSKSVVVLNTTKSAAELNKILKPQNLFIGSGYGSHKEDQVRIANFPAISVEDIKKLVEALKNI